MSVAASEAELASCDADLDDGLFAAVLSND